MDDEIKPQQSPAKDLRDAVAGFPGPVFGLEGAGLSVPRVRGWGGSLDKRGTRTTKSIRIEYFIATASSTISVDTTTVEREATSEIMIYSVLDHGEEWPYGDPIPLAMRAEYQLTVAGVERSVLAIVRPSRGILGVDVASHRWVVVLWTPPLKVDAYSIVQLSHSDVADAIERTMPTPDR